MGVPQNRLRCDEQARAQTHRDGPVASLAEPVVEATLLDHVGHPAIRSQTNTENCNATVRDAPAGLLVVVNEAVAHALDAHEPRVNGLADQWRAGPTRQRWC
jgi:hypothetical protein